MLENQIQWQGLIWQYENVSPILLAGSNPKYAVVDLDDYSWTKEAVKLVEDSGCILLGYLNIGLAEEWRNYWREEWYHNPPDWLGPKHSFWSGKYYVKFWFEEWIQIMEKEIERILNLGFSGIHFDNLDAYTFWVNAGVSNAMDLMVDFVIGRFLRVYSSRQIL